MALFDIAVIAAAALGSAALCVLWMMQPWPNTNTPIDVDSDNNRQTVSMLFEGDVLQHASSAAKKLYGIVLDQDDWKSIREKLASRFPKLPATPDLAPDGISTIPARHLEDTAAICLTREGQFLQLNMLDQAGQNSEQKARLRALEIELDNLKRASETTPHAIWQVDKTGRVIWQNAAYVALYARLHQHDPDPEKPVFEFSGEFDAETGRQRVSTQLPEQKHKDWYDVSVLKSDEITIFHAVDINAVVKSEIAQRNFVQTLAKTFAQLSIGLAIFDRNGQLALFNPALIDLTALPADFLSLRPDLFSFFDRLRDRRMMPEPKNYSDWREQLTALVTEASHGQYSETWTLPSGLTYRISGRPHPDGAVAFLFEDISAEISRTRNFRAELELGQSLMDTFDDALVVFSSTGVLTFCNLAYRGLWKPDPDNSFADVTINDSVLSWKDQCAPGAQWAALADFVLDFGEKSSWEMPAKLRGGDALTCTVSRIASAATIIRFAKSETPANSSDNTIADGSVS